MAFLWVESHEISHGLFLCESNLAVVGSHVTVASVAIGNSHDASSTTPQDLWINHLIMIEIDKN